MSDDEPDWRRLHPGAALLQIVRSVPQALPALFAMLAVGRDGFGVLAMLLAGVAAATLAVAVLKWWRLRYRITADALLIEQGVLRRSHRSIPRSRIQDVSIEQDLLRRLLGIVKLRMETGGGDANEADLDSVSRAEAARLRALLRQEPGLGSAPAAASEAAPAPELVFAMPIGRVLLQGLFGFSLIWIAVLFGVLQMVEEAIDVDWRELIGMAGAAAAGLSVVAIAAVLGAAVLLGMLTGVARVVARDYNFHLFHARGRFRRVRGLLTRTEAVIADARIQLGLIRRGMVSGRLGWCAVEVQTLGGSDDPGGRQQMAPFASAVEAGRVLATAGLPAFDPEALAPVARAHGWRCVIASAGPVVVAAGAAGLWRPEAWLALGLAVPIAAVAMMQRSRHRYALLPESLQVTRGVLARREWIVPYAAVQAVTVQAGWLQRRMGLATLSVSTAGASGTARPDVIDLTLADAREAARLLIARAQAGSSAS